MKTVERMRLEQVLRDYKKMKNVCKWSTYYGEDILIDRCQYWDDPTQYTGFCIVVRANHPYLYEISIWKDTEDGPEFYMNTLVGNVQITWTIENLFMSAQHLYLEEPDRKNIPWKKGDFARWWKDHAPFPISFTHEPKKKGE